MTSFIRHRIDIAKSDAFLYLLHNPNHPYQLCRPHELHYLHYLYHLLCPVGIISVVKNFKMDVHARTDFETDLPSGTDFETDLPSST